MYIENIKVKDQFGAMYAIKATVERHFLESKSASHIQYITVDGEDIRPSFEMCFQSRSSGKIFKVIKN